MASAAGGLEEIVGAQLVTAAGEKASPAELRGKVIGLYFSAEWCPPCRAFTPVLTKFREANKADFEVVLVSGDRSAKSQQEYMKKYSMAWPAIAFDSPQRNEAFDRFGVRGIPALVILDADGKLLERDGRNQISRDPEHAMDRWLPGRQPKAENPKEKPTEAKDDTDTSALDKLEAQTKDALGKGFEFLRTAQEVTAPYVDKLRPSESQSAPTNN